MDGNRRWAKEQKLDAIYGHKAGAKALMNLCKTIRDKHSIQNLTVYAFSSENISRSKEELDNLFKLLDEYLDSDIKKLQKENINVKFFGDFSIFKKQTQEKIAKINETNLQKFSYNLNIALNYGGRQELCHAFAKLAGKTIISQEDSTGTISEIMKKLCLARHNV